MDRVCHTRAEGGVMVSLQPDSSWVFCMQYGTYFRPSGRVAIPLEYSIYFSSCHPASST